MTIVPAFFLAANISSTVMPTRMSSGAILYIPTYFSFHNCRQLSGPNMHRPCRILSIAALSWMLRSLMSRRLRRSEIALIRQATTKAAITDATPTERAIGDNPTFSEVAVMSEINPIALMAMK